MSRTNLQLLFPRMHTHDFFCLFRGIADNREVKVLFTGLEWSPLGVQETSHNSFMRSIYNRLATYRFTT